MSETMLGIDGWGKTRIRRCTICAALLASEADANIHAGWHETVMVRISAEEYERRLAEPISPEMQAIFDYLYAPIRRFAKSLSPEEQKLADLLPEKK